MKEDERIAGVLRDYKKQRASAKRELRNLPPGSLNTQRRQGEINYIHRTTVNSKRVRRGITKDRELIYALARKAYLTRYIALLTETIAALEPILKTCPPPTPDVVLASLPETFRTLPEEAFFPQQRRLKGWKYKDYDKSTYRPEEKRHTACTGEKVRSKSEALIIDLLEKYAIAYRYEQMLYIENQEFVPDFTVLKGEEVYYWEHCGMVNDPKYIAAHNWKVSIYARIGIVPWKNLIITYDDEKGHFNGLIAESEIKNKLLR